MHINRCPQTPFVAADQSDKAAVDTNWFAWWTKRGYIYLETISLIWKNEQWPQDWEHRRIALFKQNAQARFCFQAGSNVIIDKREQTVRRKWFELLKKFAMTEHVLEVDLVGCRTSTDGITYKHIYSKREEKGEKDHFADFVMSKMDEDEFADVELQEQQANSLTITYPIIIDQTEGDEELEQLEEKDRFGENTKYRSPIQIEADRIKIKGAVKESIEKIELESEPKSRLLEI